MTTSSIIRCNPQGHLILHHITVDRIPLQNRFSQKILSPAIVLRSSTSTVSANSVTSVRITLPSNTSISSLLDVLVVEAASGGKVDGHIPQWVRAGVLGSAERDCVGGVPVSEGGDAADDVNVLAVCGGLLLVEGYSDGGWGCAGPSGGGGSGRCTRVAPVGVGCGSARTRGRTTGARRREFGL